MKKLALFILGAAVSLLLPSCFESEVEITLNKDGSGVITETIKFGPKMAGMMDMAAAQGEENPLAKMKNADEARKKAASYGEGVTFVKAEDIKDKNGSKGVRLTYKFKDINEIALNPAGGMSSLGNMQGGGIEVEGDAEQKATFRYTNGRLIIKVPKPENEEGADEGEEADIPELDPNDPQAAMMMEMMKGMKMSAKLVIKDGISETTATYREGNTVTLLEMNLDEVMKNKDGLGALNKLGKLQGKDPKAAAEALKKMKGVKAETKEEVVVIVK